MQSDAQEHRNHVAASWREAPSFPQITTARPPAPGSSATGKPARYPVTLFTSLVCCTITELENAVFGTPGRIAPPQIDFPGRLPNPLETFMIEIAISCDMSQTFGQRMNSDPKQKRERFQQLTQNPKVKTGKVFAADLRKSKIHPTVKKLTDLAQTKPTVSTQSGGGPSTILFPCHFRLAPKLGRRSPIAKFTYCRHSRKILARPSDRRAAQKMNQPKAYRCSSRDLAGTGGEKANDAEAVYHTLGTLLSRWLLARSNIPKWRRSNLR